MWPVIRSWDVVSLPIVAMSTALACLAIACGGDGSSDGSNGDGGPDDCVRTSCEAEGATCGVIDDGCGEALVCGTCRGGDICGAAGVPNECGPDMLSTATGCAGVYNPDQVLDLRLTMEASDWSSLKGDATNSVYFAAGFQCGDEEALPFDVGVRRKRSGSVDKPGLKVDFNTQSPDGEFYGLKKLSLENGISEGSSEAELKDPIAEYMSWRVMVRSGAMSGRAAFARVFVNGELIGVYVSVEQVDKRFLASRIGENDGWLFKLSGSPDDGYKTNEGIPNPYEERMCFWEKNPCDPPPSSELDTYLPTVLDIDQMLRFGGANALIGNADAPFVKDNNFIFYDGSTGAPRVYFPWDLDTTWRQTPAIFGAPGTGLYTDVLFTHWEDDYDLLLTDLLTDTLTVEAVRGELDRVESVASAALEADPVFVGASTSETVDDFKTWWSARHAQVAAELDGHDP